jgi:hypothetical protein
VTQAQLYAILWSATASQLLPVAAALRGPRPFPAHRKWLAVWCLILFTADLTGFVVSRVTSANLWVRVLTHPVMDATLLWALSLWQTSPFARIAMRVGIGIFIPVWLATTLLIDGARQFKSISAPLESLVLLVAVLYTVLSQAYHSNERPARADWLWLGTGLALYFGLTPALQPVLKALYSTDPDLAIAPLVTKVVLDIFAFVLIAVGMLCPLPRPTSGKSL